MANLNKKAGKENNAASPATKTKKAKSKKASKSMFANAKPKKTVSISSRDKKLLIVLGAVIIFLCTYFFGFSNQMTEIQDIEAESETLKLRIAELTQRAAQAEGLKEETASIREGMKEKLDEFPSELNTEDVIYFLNQLEEKKENELKISMESFGTLESFYNTAEVAAQAAPPVEGEDVTADASGTIYYDAPQYATANTAENESEEPSETAGEESTEDASGQDAMEQLEAAEQKMLEEGTEGEEEEGLNTDGPYTGYRMNVNLTYETTYSGIKHVIDMINKHKDKVRIQTISAAFDNSTGALSGSMALSFYAIGGNGKKYTAPSIKGIPLGLDNIFGTVSKNADTQE